jgi:tripartite ATP-independent transporter DctM subunit
VSISALFLAGYVPGLLWGLAVMILVWFLAKKRGYPSAQKVDLKTAIYTILDAVPALSLIIIVIGGILAGIFTATEGSAIAVVYSLILSIFYKSITLKQLKEIILSSVKTTAIVILMVGVSTIMSWVLSYTHIPEIIAKTLLNISGNKYVILIIINLVLLFIGTFMDPTPAILIFTPIFLPICKSFGMSPIHFGIMITMNLCIGLITPPVGNILYVGCKVGNVQIEAVVKSLLMFFAVITLMLLLTTYIPQISLALPTWFGLIK